LSTELEAVRKATCSNPPFTRSSGVPIPPPLAIQLCQKATLHTHRSVGRLVVDVHERALDVRQHLDLVLQLLAHIVRLPQWGIRRHHNVHLDEVVLPPAALISATSYSSSLKKDSQVRSIKKQICSTKRRKRGGGRCIDARGTPARCRSSQSRPRTSSPCR
jgi:hypothetical protein